MERWRTSGFVPDSDDEEELDSQQTGVPGEKQVEHDVIQDNTVDGVWGDRQRGESDGGHTEGKQIDRHERPQPQVVIQESGQREPADILPEINDANGLDLDCDPLQDDDDPTARNSRNGQLDVPGEAPSNMHGSLRPETSSIEGELPSSPDELQFSQHLPPRPPVTPVGQSSHDVPGPHESLSSSPLSSPPSNLESPRSFHVTSQDDGGGGEDGHNAAPEIAPEVDDVVALGELPSSTTHGRSLRPRNADQINPFRIDIARYEKSCRDAGIAPERIRSFIRRQSPDYEGAHNGGQDESVPPSNSPSQTFRFPPNTPSGAKSREKKRIHSRRSSSDGIQSIRVDGQAPTQPVPDPRVPARTTTYSGYKRRKLNHHPEARPGGKSPSATGWTFTEAAAGNSPAKHAQGGDTTIFDVPISPPPSDSPTTAHNDQENAVFRFPHGYNPPPIPTPTTEQRSSHIAREPENSILLDSSPQSDVEQDSILQQDDEVQSISDSPEDQALGINSMKRRIKGVLPASWIRCDQQDQGKRAKAQAEKERLRRMRNDRQGGKGVAQRVSTSNRAVNPRSTDFLPHEDSDTEDGNGLSAAVQRPALQPIDNPPGFNEDDDIPEDNHIDSISPPVMRRRTNFNKRANTRHTATSNTPSRRGLRQPRITESGTRNVPAPSPKLRIPRVGILDAPDVKNRQTQNQPQFLRVALRRARSRRNQGRSSPTRKFFRLANRRDTEDANLRLREWREGTIVPTTEHDQVGARECQPEPQVQPNLHHHFDSEDSVQLTGPASDRAGPAVRAASGSGADGNRETDYVAEAPLRDVGEEPPDAQRQTQTNNNRQQRRTVRKGYVLSSLRRNVPRPADLDYPTTSNTRRQPTSSFQQSLSALDASYRDARSSNNLNRSLPLARFLSYATDAPKVPKQSNATSARNNDGIPQRKNRAGGKVTRKRQPQHIDADAVERRQLPIAQPDIGGPASVSPDEVTDVPQLKGLQSIVRTCSVDFDTPMLKVGTYFHDSTFTGSGTFSRSLSVSSRNMDAHNNHANICYNGLTYCWDYWNESVSSEAEILFDTIIGSLSDTSCQMAPSQATDAISKASELYQSLICYVNDNLSFMDAIDRRMFVDKSLKLLSKAMDVPRYNNDENDYHSNFTEYRVRIEAFNLIFANQVRQIAAHEVVDRAKLDNVIEAIMASGARVFNMIVSGAGLRNIRCALDENKRQDQREAGIKEKYPFVEAYLIARQVLYNQTAVKAQLRDDPFSRVLIDLLSSNLHDVHSLEKVWFALFSIQPLHELDEFGILQPGLRFPGCVPQWHVVNQLVSKVFEWYEASRRAQPVFLNSYVRTLFLRCFSLIDDWGWRYCKLILQTLFDFFAKNALHNLRNEETHGSPGFLDELNKRPRIGVDSRDSCFHVLLKIVAAGLRTMSEMYDKKSIRNLAWRLLPNHGRTYPKEEPLRQEDLDALRNHHDLLCTLYSSTPHGCRPPLKTVRQLVHPASSHKEACSINIRAWLRLVKYKISTNEDESELEEFADWHSEFTAAILKQHSLARTEIEAQNTLDSFVNSRFVEDAISKNQRQVESLVSSALIYLKAAIEVTNEMSQAKILIGKLPLERLLGLFDPRSRRLGEVICQVLDVVVAYCSTSLSSSSSEPPAAVDTSEDSQEYGDWTVFNDFCDGPTQTLHPGVRYIDNAIRPTVSQFVSRCFGEDLAPDDTVLLKVIHCWTSVAFVLVKHGLRQWRSYLNPYDGDSWMSLRSTDQTRRFMPHFLATIVEEDVSAYQDCQSQLLSCWIVSLVERGSMLKYQHQTTSVLLNADGMNNPLFKNLPFSVNKLSGRYEIPLDEICQRRVSLISCLLSNMREHLLDVEPQDVEAGKAVRDQYVDMIRALMTSMKHNYEELGNSSEPVHVSYVDFVHRIVEFLQQHSQDICPLDPFFTDPKSFPLPASDPTYITARLKSYGVRLNTARTAKPLASFIQGVSERAVLDDQQNYLVDQLYNATSCTFQNEDYQSPTLRTFLLQCIYPAYVENSFMTPAAWLLVQPLLRSITRMFADLILDIDATNTTSVCIVVDSIRVYFEAVDNSLQILLDHPGLLEEPSFLLTLTSFMETVVASLALIDYLDSMSDNATVLVAYIEHFKQFALFAVSFLDDPATATAPESFDVLIRKYDDGRGGHAASSMPAYYAETRGFAACELRSWLRNGWSVHEGKYYVRQGARSKEVHVSPLCKSAEVARGALVRTVEIFFGTIQRLETFEFLRVEVQSPVEISSSQDDDSRLWPLI